jgi:hypothetical protein
MIAEDWAPGITNYTTGGHGGVGLTEKRAAELRYHANFDSDGRTSPSAIAPSPLSRLFITFLSRDLYHP